MIFAQYRYDDDGPTDNLMGTEVILSIQSGI